MNESIDKVPAKPQSQQASTYPATPRPYSGFDGLYIGGSWRPGKLGGKEIDKDPHSGETLAEIVTVRHTPANYPF